MTHTDRASFVTAGAAWRSLLFVPGSRPERFDKALATDADLVCIDLEDAVAPDRKGDARAAAIAAIADGRGGSRLGVRVNPPTTEVGRLDLAVLDKATDAAFVMIPKAETIDDLALVRAAFGAGRLIPVLETARGVLAAETLADHEAVIAGVYGAIDLAGDTGMSLDWEAQLHARSRCALAFAAARKPLFDTPWLDVTDAEGLKQATRRARGLGIMARTAIHPAQVGPIHEALAPTPDEVAQAERIMAAFEAGDGDVVLLDGKMVELPVIRSARRTLAAARRTA